MPALFFVIFNQFLLEGYSRIQTRIGGAEGEKTDHLTATTAQSVAIG